MWPSIRGCASTSSAPEMSEIAAPPNASMPSRPGRLIARLSDNDLLASFLASKVTVAAGLVTLVLFLAALLAPLDRADRPVQSGDQFPHGLARSRRASSPAEIRASCSARTTRGATCCRRSSTGFASRLRIGFCSVALGAAIGVTLGLVAGYAGGWVGFRDHADRRRAAHLSGDSASRFSSTASRMRCSEPASRDKSAFAVLVLSIGLSFWVQYARTVRGFDHGREEPRLRAGGAADRAFARAHPAVAISFPT